MELQHLLLGRDYLQRAAAAAAGPCTGGYHQLNRAATAASIDIESDDEVRLSDRTLRESQSYILADCHSAARSSLHDVSLLLRHRQRHQRHQQPHPVSAMMQYPPPPPPPSPSQNPLRTPAAAAAAIVPYYGNPYYQRSAPSSASSQQYLPAPAPSQYCLPDGSRYSLMAMDSFTAAGPPVGLSYEQHAAAALLRESAVSRLAETASRCAGNPAADSRLAAAGYCAVDPRRCTGATADPPAASALSLPPPPSSPR